VVNKTLDLVLDINRNPESKEKLLNANTPDYVPGWQLIYNENTDFYLKK
jgi:hypothetical protein